MKKSLFPKFPYDYSKELLLIGGLPPADELDRDHRSDVSCPLPEPGMLVTASPEIEDKALTSPYHQHFRGSVVFNNYTTRTFELSHDSVKPCTKSLKTTFVLLWIM
jgi:hypothetical protein